MLGAGPGLGASVARRFQSEGYAPALVSRRGFEQPGMTSYATDLTDPGAVEDVLARIKKDLGPIDTLYFGPAAALNVTPLPSASPADIAAPIEALLLPAVAAVRAVLPGMLERGAGSVLLPAGLSGPRPMAMLGTLAPASAAIRMYALTLHEALIPEGVFAGALTIGGLIARGDIHAMVTAQNPGLPTLDPDEIAETAWQMTRDRTRAEAVFENLPGNPFKIKPI